MYCTRLVLALSIIFHVDTAPLFCHTSPRAERWLSGRKRHPAKVLYSSPGTKGSNPFLSAIFISLVQRIRTLSLLAFSGIFLTGCSFGAPSSPDSATPTSYEITPEYGLSVPASWEIYPKEEYPATILFAAKQNIFTTGFPASVSVSTAQARPTSLEQFVVNNLEIVRKKSQDMKVVSQTNVSDANADKMLVEYSERRSQDSSRIGLFSLYVIPKTVQQSYVITMLFDPSISSSEKEELQKIVLSFNLKKSQ